MCLAIKTREPVFKIAEEDIVCYKLIRHGKEEYTTAYRGVKIPKLCIWGWKKFKAEGDYDFLSMGCSSMIYGGVIHTFQTMFGAMDMQVLDVEEVWECVIPKGTKYVEGAFHTLRSSYHAYGSECIKFVKRVD